MPNGLLVDWNTLDKPEDERGAMRPSYVVAAVLGSAAVMGLVVLGFRSCARPVTIADVLSRPEQFYGSVVRVDGVVSNATPSIKGFAVYQLDDGSGEVWVVTRKAPPSDAVSVRVKGRVNKPVQLGALSLGTHLVEDTRSELEQ